jgi:hypothetical protein
MALSFLYLAFVQTLELLRLCRRDKDSLAVEVVMLRHEVAPTSSGGPTVWVPKMPSNGLTLPVRIRG